MTECSNRRRNPQHAMVPRRDLPGVAGHWYQQFGKSARDGFPEPGGRSRG